MRFASIVNGSGSARARAGSSTAADASAVCGRVALVVGVGTPAGGKAAVADGLAGARDSTLDEFRAASDSAPLGGPSGGAPLRSPGAVDAGLGLAPGIAAASASCPEGGVAVGLDVTAASCCGIGLCAAARERRTSRSSTGAGARSCGCSSPTTLPRNPCHPLFGRDVFGAGFAGTAGDRSSAPDSGARGGATSGGVDARVSSRATVIDAAAPAEAGVTSN
jgi:hypothetical protein